MSVDNFTQNPFIICPMHGVEKDVKINAAVKIFLSNLKCSLVQNLAVTSRYTLSSVMYNWSLYAIQIYSL